MDSFSKLINRRSTFCTQWDYIKDRFGQEDLLPFSISDMDFRVPENILNVFSQRVSHGIFGYSRWDHDEYKNAIVNWYKKRFFYTLKKEYISYTPNVIYAIAKLLNIVVHKNHTNNKVNDVLIFTPCYDGFIKILKANNFSVEKIKISDDLSFNPNDFEKICAKSKVILLCNPNNPNGKLWSEVELNLIANIAKKYNTFIISDDIHMDIVYEGHKFSPILKVAETLDYLDYCMIVTSNSKTFNISSVGGAYCLIPSSEIKNNFLEIIKNIDSLGSPMILSVLSIIEGYNSSINWLNDLNKYCLTNLKFVDNFLIENNLPIKFRIPKATYFAWLNCEELNISSMEIQKKLISAKVAIMKGDIYEENRSFLRLNIACPKSKLEEGLNKLKMAFNML